jgi:hypothetical protein
MEKGIKMQRLPLREGRHADSRLELEKQKQKKLSFLFLILFPLVSSPSSLFLSQLN